MSTPQLPALPEVTRLSPSCIRILAGNPGRFTLQGTNTYLLGSGSSRLLIDTGEGRPSWISALHRVLQDEGASLAATLITHWHHDHTGGIVDVLKAWPGTAVYKHGGAVGDGDTALGEGVQEMRDGQRFVVDGASLAAVHTPGHTTDHVVLVWEEAGAVFTGDNVLGHGTSVFGDLGAYVDSLERMRGLFGSGTAAGGQDGVGGSAFPGHGPVVTDGVGKIAEYIQHRAQREEQVVQTLRAENSAAAAAAAAQGTTTAVGSEDGRKTWTVMELVRSIYRNVPESLHPAAAGGVVQILQKLAREGKAVLEGDGERWRLAGAGRSVL
ncbi:beta-lactamase-like protein [Staphylotrichum tortipilum]|uniref:Beta-lactamase-like protein n=1 Tax=Staphylotrichum tortipilum TaxID=2831512 RepID=A0AAN6RXN0_9PEZI|nr:beta-lactamase-like protein [Staphylotrichum longicolle]